MGQLSDAEKKWFVEREIEDRASHDGFVLEQDTSTLEAWLENSKRDVWFKEGELNKQKWEVALIEDELKRRKKDEFVWKSNNYW